VKRCKYAAYHEAGHAILGDYFDVLLSVAISPGPVTEYIDCDLNITSSIQYAGVLAQARYERRNLAGLILSAGGQDFELIEKAAAQLETFLPFPPTTIMNRWRDTARSILRSRWPAVVAVATALMKDGRLDARVVRSMVANGATS
jgi:hypothetical protein